ncbi:MAG TPA: carboxypeptidase-like regulatory domain-containing protein [Terriglobia bacterium]|nr:carboxypeptidase-like regulatory domain-containing protein [Terriglobia bacterium]
MEVRDFRKWTRPGKALTVFLLFTLALSSAYGLSAAQEPQRSVLGQTAATAVTEYGSISGIVTDRLSEKPISGATVKLSWPAPAAAVTGDDGTFTFRSLWPGSYGLTVTVAHYLPMRYGQRVVDGLGRPVTIQSGERFSTALRLTKTSAIEGTIVDGNGAPLAHAEIQALTPEHFLTGGGRLFRAGTATRTDGQGRYRLEDLGPGDYYVSATEIPDELRRPQGITLPLFYPGASDPDAATPVHVVAGDEVHGIDFAIRPAQPGRVLGAILPVNDGVNGTGQSQGAGGADTAQSTRVTVALVYTGLRTDQQQPVSRSAVTDGTFQFNEVFPGTYKVVAVNNAAGRRETAIRDVTVKSGAVGAVTLQLRPAIDVRGRISADGPIPSGVQIPQMLASLRCLDELPSALFPNRQATGTVSANINADGSFVLRDVIPDLRYSIGFAPGDHTGGYLEGARYGNTETLGTPVTVRDEGPAIQLRIGFDLARVEIVVRDPTHDNPQPHIPTLLVPRSRGHSDIWGIYPIALSDTDGRVFFSDVTPGDYEALALEDVPARGAFYGSGSGIWPDSQYLEQFKGQGQLFHVEAGQTIRKVIPVIGADATLNGLR